MFDDTSSTDDGKSTKETPIEIIDWSARTLRILRENGKIRYVEELTAMTVEQLSKLTDYRGYGYIDEIKDLLRQHGKKLRGEPTFDDSVRDTRYHRLAIAISSDDDKSVAFRFTGSTHLELDLKRIQTVLARQGFPAISRPDLMRFALEEFVQGMHLNFPEIWDGEESDDV